MALTLDGTTGVSNIQDGVITSADFAATGALPTGSVLQVVRGTYSVSTAISTDAYADTGLTATITPKSASSRILALGNIKGLLQVVGALDVGLGFKILRGSTEIYGSNTEYEYYIYKDTSGTQNWRGSMNFNGEDSSHNSTTALTYKVQVGAYQANNSNSQVYIHQSGNDSTLILMEIAG